MSVPPVWLIAGPTASGKTALAIHAARRLGGEVVNADSMQIYADIPVLSAAPSLDEQADIPHHLFGVLDASERASVGWWARAAMSAIAEIRSRGKRPVVVGGTGLYFNALTDGLAEVPDIPAQASQAAARIADRGADALRIEAERHDTEGAARVLGDDVQRLRRIVEVGLATGRPLSSFHGDTVPLLQPGEWRGVVIEPDREALYARIDARFDRMLAAGALDEVAALDRRELDPELPAMKALGVPQLIALRKGEMTRAEAEEYAKRESRRYAKRQYTWFRNRCADWPRIGSLDPVTARAEFDALLEGET
ncbi:MULTISPECIES: tRNA (adenosine(37)-N6)-dimethylallyltransferase MiaA [Hyphobacterium]|uniref:tRNA dimethylallyltransferase n=1 Tax=Hyphobacterium vulgare TaxID=1736751 RepID=A0ABV6ZZS4_9PROT